jgi:hypothetical protein
VRIPSLAAAVALLLTGSGIAAQEHGPTLRAARGAFAAPASADRYGPAPLDEAVSCGSAFKNAALLGLGLSLATAVLELTYTFLREPFVLNGHDLPRADPRIIAWAGAAGFIGGYIGTAICRRRR